MKLITFEDIKNLNIDPAICFEWVSEMITKKKMAVLPPKISLHPFEGAFCNVMPSIIPSHGGGKNCQSLSWKDTKFRQ